MLAAMPSNLAEMGDDSPLVTIPEASAILGVSKKTIYEWIGFGWLTPRSAIDPVKRRRRTVFDRQVVEALAAERRAGILREVPRRPVDPPA